jgi:glycosyltransferase involved in cell wall biosynthesis
MPRIALISEHASPLATLGGVDSGGQNVYVAQLAKRLSRRGFHVDVFTRRDDPAQPSEVAFEDARIIHVPAGPARRIPKEQLLPHMDEFTRFMARMVRDQGAYDLIHANFFMSALVAANVKRLFGIPFVVTFHALGRVRRLHQLEADAFPAERLSIEDRIVAEADRIIAECPQDWSDLVEHYRAEPRKLTMAPCGFDEEEFDVTPRGVARRALGLDASAFTVLQLGRMVARKGVDNVIRAVALLRQRTVAPIRLLIVGGESRQPNPAITPEIGRLQAIAASEGIADAVTFVGSRARHELRRFYAACDVFVTTPWYEPFGITPVEAMACGRPVIGASVGGIQSTVKDGVTGFLVPPRDPQALANRLAALHSNPVLATRMGAQAARHARRHFSWERVVDKIVRIYAPVMPEAKPAHSFAGIS